MKARINEIVKLTISLLALIALICLTGCDENPADSDLSEQQIIAKIIEEDADLNSVDDVINEKSFTNIIGKVNEPIFPKNWVKILNLKAKNLDLQVNGDTAIGILTKEYDGKLLILAAYTANINPDTVITKQFQTTLKRKLVFVKTEDAQYKRKNENKGWKLVGISLAKTGTSDENVLITKVQVITANDTITVENPLDYIFYRGYRERFKNQLRNYSPNQPLNVKVFVRSCYERPEYVTLTYGFNDKAGAFRITRRYFKLEEQAFDGTCWNRVYTGSWNAQPVVGTFHAVINAISNATLKDDKAEVEYKGMGLPYNVR
jgi:hypothetical protein